MTKVEKLHMYVTFLSIAMSVLSMPAVDTIAFLKVALSFSILSFLFRTSTYSLIKSSAFSI
jgi:hypothetical protein